MKPPTFVALQLSRSSEVNGSQLVGIARLELQVNPGDQNALIRAYNLAKQALSYFPAFQDQAESVSKEPSSFEKWFKSLVGTVSGMPWDEMLATKEVVSSFLLRFSINLWYSFRGENWRNSSPGIVGICPFHWCVALLCPAVAWCTLLRLHLRLYDILLI